jgi:nucleoid-associated protein YgaU
LLRNVSVMTPFAIRMIALAAGALATAIGGFVYWRSAQGPAIVATAPPPAGPASRTQAANPPAPQTAATQPSAAAPQATPSQSGAPAAAPPSLPEFDVVRVSPSGETVVAGRAPGAARVELLDNDRVIAGDKVDQNGQFVLLPPPLTGGDHLLALRITPEGKPPVTSTQSVAVAVRPSTSPVVTLAEPGKPSVVLAAPEPARAAPAQKPAENTAAPANPQVMIRTAEVEAGGRFFATGTAPAGSTVRLYLNGTHVADAAAAGDGKWSLTIGKGVSGGKYALRADAVGEHGKVVSRAEVPFDVPVAVAAAPAPQPTQPAPQAQAAAPSSAVTPPASGTPPSGSPAQPASSPKEPETPRQPALARPGTDAAASVPSLASPPAEAQQPATPKPASSTAVAANAPASNAPTANPVVSQISTATVTRGDSLWRISRKLLGNGARYTIIYEANARQIRNPNLIYSGQVFVIPSK